MNPVEDFLGEIIAKVVRNLIDRHHPGIRIQNVTNFQDNVTADKHTITYAYHKAFSPNRQFMAVNSVISSGTASSSSDTPILQIFAADGSGGSLATVHVGFFKDGIHHDGMTGFMVGDNTFFFCAD